MSNGYAYTRGMRFRVENYDKGSNVLKVLVKSTVRKDGLIVSSFPVEQYNKEKVEWRKVECRHIVSVASLRHPPEKGKGLAIVHSLWPGVILCLHDPQPTWEDEDVNRQ